MDAERWSPVVGFEVEYEVSDLGQFRRLGAGKGAHPGRDLSTKRRNAKGYVVVELSKGDTKQRFLAHQLVARAFLGAPGPEQIVNHLDGVKTNNAVSNLEWCTRAENNAHAAAHGLLRPVRGENNGRSKLTVGAVAEIRLLEGALSQREIARRYGVARSLVQRIHQGKAWAALGSSGVPHA